MLREQDVDIALLSETLLTKSVRISCPGYHIYRLDEDDDIGGRPKRGLAVLVRRRLVHQVLPSHESNTLQALGIETLIENQPHRLYAVYRPPKPALVTAEIRNLLDPTIPTVLAGDWNAKSPAWNSSTYNTAGRRLQHDAETYDYNVMGPDAPTHYHHDATYSPDVIDIVVFRGLQHPPVLEVLCDSLGSDHVPVLAILTGHDNPLQPLPRKKIKWEIFEKAMAESTPTRPTSSPVDVETLATDLTMSLQSALEAATTHTETSNRRPPLPHHIQTLISKKRSLRRQWQATRCPAQKSELNRLTAQIKTALHETSTADWEAQIESASEDYQSLQKLIRRVTGAKPPIRPLIHEDGNLRYRAEDRAEILARHLEAQFTPFASRDPTHTDKVEKKVTEIFADSTPAETPFFTPGMVRRAMMRTKPRKAPGADGITNAALRHLPRPTTAAITRLYNGILRTGHFPSSWKIGIVILILKPGKNPLKPESYRPITLLSTLSKIFEKLLLTKLTAYLTPRPEQFGFRAEHSTTHQLARVLHLITSSLNKKEKAAAAFLDMEKAFDRVWHDGLLYKIATKTETPPALTRIIRSFLTDRKFRVRVDGVLSSEKIIRAGVPQGSCLSPVLYACYTDDIPSSENVALALYADDAAYVATSMNSAHAARKLQKTLDLLPEWLTQWRMSANAKKTQAILLGPTRKTPPRELSMLGETIPWSHQVKYLGLTIDKNLTMKPHIKKTAALARVATFALSCILKAKLPLRFKVGVYKTYIRSRLTYAAPAWYALASESNKKILRARQSQALRILTGAPRYVRNSTISRDLRIESIDEFVRGLSVRFFARADQSNLQHIRGIAPWHARPPERALPRDLIADQGHSTDSEEEG